METIGEEHDIDWLSAVAMFRTLTVWPADINKVNATCRLEKKGLVKVRRFKTPDTCYMHVTATIPTDDTVTRAAIAAVETQIVSIEITVR